MRKALIIANIIFFSTVATYAQQARPEGSGAAGAAPPNAYYQLTFVIRELNSQHEVVNARSYSMIARNNTPKSSIRAGERVPFASTTGSATQWQQIDVGVNIDCLDLTEGEGNVSVRLVTDISSVADVDGDKTSQSPIIRSNRWDSTVVVPLKQQTTLFSSEDPASKRTMQLQLTVVPVRS